jgi:hypothetical protein
MRRYIFISINDIERYKPGPGGAACLVFFDDHAPVSFGKFRADTEACGACSDDNKIVPGLVRVRHCFSSCDQSGPFPGFFYGDQRMPATSHNRLAGMP